MRTIKQYPDEEGKMKLYTAGPMTWVPQFNYPAFDVLADALREAGFAVQSPAELDSPEIRERAMASIDGNPDDLGDIETWGDMLARDVKIIADQVDGVVLMPGWEESKGARLEAFVCRHVGKPVFYATPVKMIPFPADHSAVCFCNDLGLEDWDFDLVELDDAELDHVLTAGDTLTLMKMERDANRTELWGMPVMTDKALEDDEIVFQTDSGATHVYKAGDGKLLSTVDTPGDEVRVKDPDTGGEKGAKLARFDLIPTYPLWQLAEHYGAGAEKYAERNWERGYVWSLCYAAAMRHLTLWWEGEDLDPETGSHHLTAVAWHMFALLHFDNHDLGKDDRP